jgi:phospholipase D
MAKPKLNRSTINHILNFFGFSKTPIRSIVTVLALGISLGVAYEEMYGISTWHSYHTKTEHINVCFTPPSGCGSLIAQEIVKARANIYVQAYGLTSSSIINQLKAARNRGVHVQVLLDGGNLSDNAQIYRDLSSAGIETAFDKMPGIAHNKVMIIDNKKVITGSFNFTAAADSKNAENVLLIEDKNIASLYVQNWIKRKNTSKSLN